MSTLLLLGIVTGLDNFRVGVGLGALGMTSRRRWALAPRFALFEAAMPVVGAALGAGFAGDWAEGLGVVLPAAIGVCVLVPLARGIDASSRVARSPLLFLLPLLLSFDN